MDMNFILASIGVFLVTILLLVVILLVAKKYLSPSGNVNITITGIRRFPWRKAEACFPLWLLKGFTCLLPAVVKVLADSANVRW